MERLWRLGLGAGAGLAAFGAAAIAHAGGGGGGKGCNCTPPPPPCNCTVPTGHNVWIPGINVTPPSVTVNSPTITVSAPSIDVQASSFSQSSANASSSANANATGSAFGSAMGQAQSTAFANGLALGAGGGSSFSTSEGGSNYVPNFAVEGIEVPEARRICAEFRAAARMVAIQASCIDDKDIPHPASQVQPERDVGIGYEGELYRCIAGTRMQYVLGSFAGTADFSHGQTVTCVKGEALYHSAGGAMACRPQKPARDCNERSLLRRFGAGIKVAQFQGGRECIAYRTEQVQASSSGSGAIVFDGGVGGVTR